MKERRVLKGNIIYSPQMGELKVLENGFLVYEGDEIVGAYERLPQEHAQLQCEDYGNRLIIPGMVDLHVHAPQYPFRGTGMDLELLDWLEQFTFPEEARYCSDDYAQKAYEIFTDDLKKSPTTRACIFATLHRRATLILMDMLEKSGLYTMVGKVNMDRNCPDYLKESSAEESAVETVEWLKDVFHRNYKRTAPILTPRFVPSCSDELLEKIKMIQMRFQLPVQSHLSENKKEIQWVKELCPWSEFYGDAYDRFGLFGGDAETIMAHCVHSGDEEIQRMKENGVYVAHCPESNMNLSSGIAPVRRYINEGIRVGLGSDVAAGSSLNLFWSMAHAIQSSKLRWRLVDDSLKPLTFAEALYIGTKGGGEFFGKVGSFEKGYQADIVVIDDSRLKTPSEQTPLQRLERIVYVSDNREIYAKYIGGTHIF